MDLDPRPNHHEHTTRYDRKNRVADLAGSSVDGPAEAAEAAEEPKILPRLPAIFCILSVQANIFEATPNGLLYLLSQSVAGDGYDDGLRRLVPHRLRPDRLLRHPPAVEHGAGADDGSQLRGEAVDGRRRAVGEVEPKRVEPADQDEQRA